jgi:ubiquinone/menaquinone biosynthesis C-methylase UbiE
MIDIDKLNYAQFVGLINERNRPSGGIKTVQEVVSNANLNPTKKILEIGSTTGFTSVNLGLLSGAEVVGIEIDEEAVKKAREYGQKMHADSVKFVHGSALEMPFEDEVFDLVWCSNATSFIDDKQRAIKEYLRVLKYNGFLVLIPLYYVRKPSVEWVNRISKVIGHQVGLWDKQFWVELFRSVGEQNGCALEVVYDKDYRFLDRSDYVKTYVKNILVNNLDETLKTPEIYSGIEKRALELFELFNENNYKYAGYSTIILQKRYCLDEEELFLSVAN